MKKKIILALCLMLTVGCLTGCGKKDGNKNNNGSLSGSKDGYRVEDKIEVFQSLDEKLLNDAIWNNQTFFYLIDDGTDESIMLKDEVEKLARKNEWTIYYVDFDKEYDKLLKDNKAEIEDEKKEYIDTFCKEDILSPEEYELYADEELKTDSEGNYIHLRCSYAIANEKNPSANFDENQELIFSNRKEEELKESLLYKYNTSYSRNLILVYNGEIVGDTNGYLPEEFPYMGKAERKAILAESNKNLEEWFNKAIQDIKEEQ